MRAPWKTRSFPKTKLLGREIILRMKRRRLGLHRLRIVGPCPRIEKNHPLFKLNQPLLDQLDGCAQCCSTLRADEGFLLSGQERLGLEDHLVFHRQRTAAGFVTRLQHEEINEDLGHCDAKGQGLRVFLESRFLFPVFPDLYNGLTAGRFNSYQPGHLVPNPSNFP